MNAAELLTHAGWFAGRQTDAASDVAALVRGGYQVSPAAEAFLREFSGLVIEEPANPSPVVIDGVLAARHADSGWCKAYSDAIGRPLVPIGEYSLVMFWIDPEGDIWASIDNDFGRAGSSLEEAIQGLFFDKPGWKLDRYVE
jgi:hypothetical protein